MQKTVLATLLAILFSANVKSQSTGNDFFGSEQIHTVYLTFDQTAWWDSLLASNDGDFYMMADAVIDGMNYDSVGVKTKGNSSFNGPGDKKSLKIDLNMYVSGQKVDGLKKINLNNGFKDPTIIREKICLDFLHEAGIVAPRATYANVYLNNELWGLYIAVEEIDKTFLDDRLGDDKGNLFKGDPHGDLKYHGTNQTSYTDDYELHTNETQNDWSDLIKLTDIINNTTTNALKDSLDAHMNVTSFVDNWAVYNLFANMDSYLGSGHNYYVYHDSSTNKFYWLPWDVNEAFGSFLQMMTLSQIETMSVLYISNPSSNKPLEQKLIGNADYKQEYLDRICNLLNTQFDTTHLFHQIDSLANWIRPSVYADSKKFFPNNQFEQNLTTDVGNVAGLKSFLTTRINAVKNEMASLGCTVNEVSEISSEKINVYPNPFTNFLYVSNPLNDAIELCDATGRILKTFSNTNATSTGSVQAMVVVDTNDLTEGFYLLCIGNKTTKLVKLRS